jgi:hypothetical protein
MENDQAKSIWVFQVFSETRVILIAYIHVLYFKKIPPINEEGFELTTHITAQIESVPLDHTAGSCMFIRVYLVNSKYIGSTALHLI